MGWKSFLRLSITKPLDFTHTLADMVSFVTGWDVSIDEVLRSGVRRLNKLWAFNVCEGFTREDDKLPKKMYKALTGGVTVGLQVEPGELETAKDQYYKMAGWDVKTAIPTRAKLEELDLGWIADMIHSYKILRTLKLPNFTLVAGI